MAFVDFSKNSDLERILPDPYRDRGSLYDKVFYPGLGGVAGLITCALANRLASRPYHAGIHRYALIGGFIAYGGTLIDQYRKNRNQKEWAMIRHYIETHPEDFPEYPPRMKWGDTLRDWYPVRPGQ